MEQLSSYYLPAISPFGPFSTIPHGITRRPPAGCLSDECTRAKNVVKPTSERPSIAQRKPAAGAWRSRNAFRGVF
jgi:hypothetical protein